MKRNYCFNTKTFDKTNPAHFSSLIIELTKIKPLTKWEDIQVGDVFHIPNLLVYKRADFLVTGIKNNYINGMIKEENGNWKDYSLFKNEVRAYFLSKRIVINKV